MKKQISDQTPFFIIHGQIDNRTAYKNECHQLDVYTTLLDVLCIDSEWKGLGHSLLNSTYDYLINEKAHNISNMIIEGDFFAMD